MQLCVEVNKANPPWSIHIHFSFFFLCLSDAIFILQTSKVIAYAVPSMYLLRLQTPFPTCQT